MSAQTEFDLGSLIWVKGEIDQALEKARQSLNKFASGGDAAELKFTQTHLHQVRGAVEMVGLAGAARFAEELEVTVGAVQRGEVPNTALPFVTEAAGSLAQYLESLINGAPDHALKLLPTYRRVRQARGEANTSGADLFFPSLSGTLPPGLAPLTLDQATLAQLLKNARSRFEAGLLKWLKGEQREGCQWMMQALLGVARSQSGSLQRGFWWSAAAMVEGCMDNRANLDIDLKPLLARLNQQLKRLLDGGGKVAERLFRDVLYAVAKMDTQSPHCAGVRRAYGLNDLIPSGALEDDAQQLAAMQTARELRDLVNQAKENWSRVGSGSVDKLGTVQKQLLDLASRGSKLSIGGFKPLATELARVVAALTGVPEEKQALEIATAMLLLENALIVFPEQSTEFPDQAAAMQARLQGASGTPEVTLLDEVSRRAQERLLMTQVAFEIQANLGQIEQVLDDFFRDPSTRGELINTDAPIRQIRGALLMLDEQDALTVLDACAAIVKRNQSEGYQAPADELQFLAEAFSSLGFYIDAIKREDNDRARIIEPSIKLIRGEAPAEAAPTEADLIAAELESEPEPAAAIEAALAIEQAAMAPAAEPVPVEPPSAAQAGVSDAAVDEELLEVYLEEAVEVLAMINDNMNQVREHPSDRDALTVVRRGFHTLKGSGRMVGLNQLGEVAWAVEQVLNKWLQEERRATPALFQLVDGASAGFSGWVEELKQSGTALVEASALFALAEQLKSGVEESTQAEAQAPAVEHIAEPVASEPAPELTFAVEEAAPADVALEEVPLTLDIEPVLEEESAAEPLVLDMPEAEELHLDLVLEPEHSAESPIELSAELPEVAEPETSGDDQTELTIGNVVISRVLFGIFLDEAYKHFATLNDAYLDFGAHGEVRPAFVHAAHTLCGIANTTGFYSLGELGHALEQALIAHQKAGEEPSPEEKDTLSLAIDKVGNMLGQISRYIAPAEELQTVALLVAQANRLKDKAEAAAASAMPVEEASDELSLSLDDMPTLEVDAATAPEHEELQLDALDLEIGHEATPEQEHVEVAPLAGDLDLSLDFDDHMPATVEPVAEAEAHELELIAPAEVAAEPVSIDAGDLMDLDLDIELHDEMAAHEIALTIEEPAELGKATPVALEAAPIDLPIVEEPVAGLSEPADVLDLDLVLEADDEAHAEAEPEPVAIEAPALEPVAEVEHELVELLAEAPEAELIEAAPVEAEPVLLEELAVPAEEEPLVALEPPADLIAAFGTLEVSEEEMLLPAPEAEELEPLEPVAEVSEPIQPVALDSEPLNIDSNLLVKHDIAGDEESEIHDIELAPVDEAIVLESHEPVAPVAEETIAEPSPTEAELATLLGSYTVPVSAEEADGVGSVVALVGNDRLAEITVLDELDDQLLPIFLEEAQELMPQIAADLRSLRADPNEHSSVESLKRTLHTLKGSARMAGAMRLGEATHNLESRLLNAGESVLSALIDELDLDYDAIVELHDRLVHGEPVVAADEGTGADVATALASAGATAAVQPAARAGAAQALGLVDPDMGKTTVRVRADLVDRLVNQAGEVAIARTRIDSEMLALKRSLFDLTDNVGRLRNQLREIEIQAESQMQSRLSHVQELPDFDPLEFDRFSRLQELTRFMAESVNDVATVQHNLLKNLDESVAALQQQSRLTRDLQQELMRVRMVPFSSLSERLYRLVRQTGKETGKKVNLELRGGRVEIDRSVLEKMVSPFEHMLRNAIDHGLEKPETRLADGKNEFGEIQVEARQEGNELVLTLRDDGAGINLARIREKGIERGLLEAGTEYSDSHLMHLIFAAGFSTASQVTQLSGRGIGLDVVKAEIEDLGGRVDVDSVHGKGTVFTIHLPLTLAVTQTVLVKVGDKLYAIPSVMVEQVQELKTKPLEQLYQARQAEWLGNVYPFHYLPRLMGDNERQPEQKRYNTVILLRSGAQRIALHVDELVRNQEVVVKNIGPQLVRVAGVAGATVLGNGEIVLILNPLALAQRRAEAPIADFDAAVAASKATAAEMLQTAPVVMVVDDSLTVRKITGRLLAREGYQVVTAKDGVDALQQLQDVRPAVMLLDVEMPRMDGFELTRNLRANADTRDIPIIMITSRTADKHKNYAFELGVNVFLGKPYQEDELLEQIRRLIGEEVSVV